MDATPDNALETCEGDKCQVTEIAYAPTLESSAVLLNFQILRSFLTSSQRGLSTSGARLTRKMVVCQLQSKVSVSLPMLDIINLPIQTYEILAIISDDECHDMTDLSHTLLVVCGSYRLFLLAGCGLLYSVYCCW
jgi:hypothetical protein